MEDLKAARRTEEYVKQPKTSQALIWNWNNSSISLSPHLKHWHIPSSLAVDLHRHQQWPEDLPILTRRQRD